jgi:excisionase family DNA binding protein
LDKRQLAASCNITVRTVDHWMTKRLIPYLKIGKSVRFNKVAVEKALDRFTVKEVA